jgi:hypothetical protein
MVMCFSFMMYFQFMVSVSVVRVRRLSCYQSLGGGAGMLIDGLAAPLADGRASGSDA